MHARRRQLVSPHLLESRSAAGFSLVELVVTVTVSTIVVAFAAMFVGQPVLGLNDQVRRVKLVDSADAALQLVTREIRRALPNSVRVVNIGSVSALELLSTVDGARYRAGGPGTADQVLTLLSPDASFNVIGQFTEVSKPFSSSNHYLSIFNTGVPGASAYELLNVITPPGTQIDISVDGTTGEDRVSLSPAFQFLLGSPTQRIFLVEGPVSYVCDSALGTLTRYVDYSIALDQLDRIDPLDLIGAGATASLVAEQVTACDFRYAPGSSQRAGIVTLEITVGEQGEVVTLLAQAHVDNVP